MKRAEHLSIRGAESVAIKTLLIKSANGEACKAELTAVKRSVLQGDLDFSKLPRHLPVLQHVIREALPNIKRVTSIETVCTAMTAYRSVLTEIHELLRLCLTIAVTSATSERSFSTVRRLLTYLRSTMTEKRLNNCSLLHVQQDLLDEMNLVDVATDFVSCTDERIRYFEGLSTSAC